MLARKSVEASRVVLIRAWPELVRHIEQCVGIAVVLTEISACLLDCKDIYIVDYIDETGIVDGWDMCLIIEGGRNDGFPKSMWTDAIFELCLRDLTVARDEIVVHFVIVGDNRDQTGEVP